MNDDTRLVWSDEQGGRSKKNNKKTAEGPADESSIELRLRRLTTGKGRTVIEITGLPNDKGCVKS